MSGKDGIFYVVCGATWFFLLPLLIGGSLALFGFAVCSELKEIILGRTAQALDNAAARETARRMCLGN